MGTKDDGTCDDSIPQNYVKNAITMSRDINFLKRVLDEFDDIKCKDVSFYHKAVANVLVENYKNMNAAWEEFMELRRLQGCVSALIYAHCSMISDNGHHDNGIIRGMVIDRKRQLEKEQADASAAAAVQRQAEDYVQQRVQSILQNQQPQTTDQMQL